MRLNGFPNPNSEASQASIFSPAANSHTANLRLRQGAKSGSFEDFIVDAKFRPVTGEVVESVSENSKKADQAQRYSVYARIDETRRKLKEQNEGQTQDRKSQAAKQVTNSRIADKRAEETKRVTQPNTKSDETNQALREEIAQLRSEIQDVKTLARSNRDAINAMAPMQRPRFSSTYNNPINNSETAASSLSQADLHYLRYGGEQRALDIWA